MGIKCVFLWETLFMRKLYATQHKEGVPGLDPRQLLRLEKEVYGTVMGKAQRRRSIIEDLEEMGYHQSRFDVCCFLRT